MTDLPYFPAPAGSGAIGVGGAGDLVIGGNPFPWQLSAISEYANSPTLMQLVAQYAEAIDLKETIDDFFDLVWNLQTCDTFGLDNWGKLVDVSRIIEVSDLKFFGFEEGGTISYTGFNQGPFYSGQKLTNGFRLANDAYRQLIIAKAAANIWDGGIPALNTILRILFPGRSAYVTDDGDMRMTYVFNWILSPVEASVAIRSNILPRPCGVHVSYVQTP